MGQGWPLADTYRWQVTDREQVFWAGSPSSETNVATTQPSGLPGSWNKG